MYVPDRFSLYRVGENLIRLLHTQQLRSVRFTLTADDPREECKSMFWAGAAPESRQMVNQGRYSQSPWLIHLAVTPLSRLSSTPITRSNLLGLKSTQVFLIICSRTPQLCVWDYSINIPFRLWPNSAKLNSTRAAIAMTFSSPQNMT